MEPSLIPLLILGGRYDKFQVNTVVNKVLCGGLIQLYTVASRYKFEKISSLR